MAVDLNAALGNALLDRYDTEFPAGSVVEIRTGPPPGAENPASGTLLVSITSPAPPWNAASGGSKTKNGIWSAMASATGTAGHYRFRDAADSRHEEGTITIASGGGEMTLDDTYISSGQMVTINTFTKTL